MTRAELRDHALQLPEDERLRLVQELWASLDDPDAVVEPAEPIPQWQAELLDRRIEETKDDPGMTWEEVQASLWPRRES